MEERLLHSSRIPQLVVVCNLLGTRSHSCSIAPVVAFTILAGEAPQQTRANPSMIGTHQSRFVRGATPVYRLVMGSGTSLRSFDLTFSIGSQSYILSRPVAAGLPSTGFVRTYPACTIIGEDVISGTDSGEIVVYNLTNKIYRTHKRVCLLFEISEYCN